ncbi:MAG: right-handed parallel beta-helix repeat-containing protein, partial [Phycisphaerales bacterium]|nr:right-handed parallel beta-helix repeat-containing protein [Phycisphaerales bacterium]
RSAQAGPLNPPAGPVASTPGPEPRIAINVTNTPGTATSLFRITQPGSYYLTGNITGVVGKHGIEIAASGVTLDLNGFELSGVASSLSGIATEGVRNDITIVNGHVRNWGGTGIGLTVGGFGVNAIVERVTSSSNGGGGVVVPGNSVIRWSTARNNGNVGFGGAQEGLTISNCAAIQNGTFGFSAVGAASISHCTATQNTRNGISADFGSTVSDCTAVENGWEGITVFVGGTVTRCAARLNTLNGIKASNGCAIIDCTASDNVLDGINVTGNNTVRGNTCYSNGTADTIGAGIRATGTNNRIEANTCTRNDFGIDIDDPGNIIIRNTCADNTQNFVIVADNVHGPILDRTAPASPAVIGNSAAGTMGSTDHNANIAY